jgi:hypothetical protein
MAIGFFGSYLLQGGEISEKQLRDALELMYWVNRTIGELATGAGYMSTQEVEKIRRAQLASDELFGELAVEAGYLEPEQLVELLRRQKSRQLRIGDALVELGYFSEARMSQLLAKYEADQRKQAAADLTAPLLGWPLAQAIVRLLPCYALRLGHLPVKVTAFRELDGDAPPDGLDQRVRLRVAGDDPLTLAFACSRSFASGLRAKEDTAPCDGAGVAATFLRHLIARAARGDEPLAPDAIRSLEGFAARGLAYELLSVNGEALLVFEIR